MSKNFKYLQDLINSNANELVLDEDIIIGFREKRKFREGIEINTNNLVIDGNGHSIDAKNSGRIFKISGKNIVIKNITLKKGNAKSSNLHRVDYAYDGGAIVNCENSSLKIYNAKFIENKAWYGGAIYNSEESKLVLKDCEFYNNIASSEKDNNLLDEKVFHRSGLGYGGALSTGGETEIENCIFENNISEENGGAISCGGKITINNSKFIKNIAKNSEERPYNGGGAIKNEAELIISKTKFIENHSSKSGGALFNKNGRNKYGNKITNKSILLECEFENNSSKIGCSITNYGKIEIEDSAFRNDLENNGEIIFNSMELVSTKSKFNNSRNLNELIKNDSNMKIFDCEISNNSANSLINNLDTLNMNNSVLENNVSKHIIVNQKTLSVFGGEFSDNDVAETSILNDGESCYIEKTTFKRNNNKNIINKTDLTLKEIKLIDNSKNMINYGDIIIKDTEEEIENFIEDYGSIESYGRGGEKFDFTYLDELIHKNNQKEISLSHNITFEKYESDFYEGGIDLDIDNLVIDGGGNTIDGKNLSRIFVITGKNITLKNIIFKNGEMKYSHDNSFNSNGGAIRNNSNSNLSFENCKFINNKSVIYGGAIQNNTDSEITFENCEFINNASKYGGAIANKKGMLNICGCNFSKNSSQKWGGAINTTNKGSLKIKTSEFIENTSNEGGGIFNRGRIVLENVEFVKNSSQIWGGAIENDMGSMSARNCNFSDNTATEGGGAINNGSLCDLSEIKSCVFSNNIAKNGAALYTRSDVNLRHSEFYNNNVMHKMESASHSKIYQKIHNKWDNTAGAIYIEYEPRVIAYGCIIENEDLGLSIRM